VGTTTFAAVDKFKLSADAAVDIVGVLGSNFKLAVAGQTKWSANFTLYLNKTDAAEWATGTSGATAPVLYPGTYTTLAAALPSTVGTGSLGGAICIGKWNITVDPDKAISIDVEVTGSGPLTFWVAAS
jgi:hypothetical protein